MRAPRLGPRLQAAFCTYHGLAMAPRKKLAEYDRKRSFDKTPEPRGAKTKKRKPARPRKGKASRFVVQEHHARRLHWDLRLEHDGTLVSFALPKGVPQDPKQNRLARPDGNLGCALAGHFVAAVVIRREFDDSGLRVSVGKKRKEGRRDRD